MDAVGIERRHGVATLLLGPVGDRAKPERRVVNPLWRIELPTDEGERIEDAGSERGANMVRALHQAIFMADASVEQHAMDELRALVDIERILITDLKIDAETQEARRVPLDNGSGIVGCPIVLVDRIAVNLFDERVGYIEWLAQCDVIIRQRRLDGRSLAGPRLEDFRILHRHAQRTHAAHRDARDECALATLYPRQVLAHVGQ